MPMRPRRQRAGVEPRHGDPRPQIRIAGGPHALGRAFALADIVLGLPVHRWFSTPIERALLYPTDYYAPLGGRPAFLRHGRNGPALRRGRRAMRVRQSPSSTILPRVWPASSWA